VGAKGELPGTTLGGKEGMYIRGDRDGTITDVGLKVDPSLGAGPFSVDFAQDMELSFVAGVQNVPNLLE
jgi:hypothetical protein